MDAQAELLELEDLRKVQQYLQLQWQRRQNKKNAGGWEEASATRFSEEKDSYPEPLQRVRSQTSLLESKVVDLEMAVGAERRAYARCLSDAEVARRQLAALEITSREVACITRGSGEVEACLSDAVTLQ